MGWKKALLYFHPGLGMLYEYRIVVQFLLLWMTVCYAYEGYEYIINHKIKKDHVQMWCVHGKMCQVPKIGTSQEMKNVV